MARASCKASRWVGATFRANSRWLGFPVERVGQASQSTCDHREFLWLAHPSAKSPRTLRVWCRIFRWIVSPVWPTDTPFSRGLRDHDDRCYRIGQVVRRRFARDLVGLRRNRVSRSFSLARHCGSRALLCRQTSQALFARVIGPVTNRGVSSL